MKDISEFKNKVNELLPEALKEVGIDDITELDGEVQEDPEGNYYLDYNMIESLEI